MSIYRVVPNGKLFSGEKFYAKSQKWVNITSKPDTEEVIQAELDRLADQDAFRANPEKFKASKKRKT